MERNKLIRHSQIDADNFTGLEGEVTVNLDNNTVRVHDSTTKGGTEMARKDLTNVSAATSSTDGKMSATQVQALSSVQNDKADKVSSATNGNLAGLDSNGNLTDANVAPSALARRDASATTGNLAEFDANNDPVDSGYASSTISTLQAGKANKVASATNGNLAGLDANGDLTDSGVAPGDKADKVSGATNGNLAALDANGNLTDSGKASSYLDTYEASVSVSLVAGDYADSTITHGLGTDNVEVSITLQGIVVSAVAVTTDGYQTAARTADSSGVITSGAPTTPSSGDVAFRIANLTGSTQTVAAKVLIRKK